MSGVIEAALISGVLSAAASAGGAYMTNQANAANSAAQLASMGANQAANMQFNDQQARALREFNQSERVNSAITAQDMAATAFERQKELQATSMQRTVSDLRAAGLNPILAAGRGATPASGVQMGSSPSTAGSGAASVGTQAPPTLPAVENLLGGGAISAAAQAAGAVANVHQTVAQTRKTEQDTLLSAAQERQSNANTALQAAQAVTEGVRPDNVRAGTRLLGAQTNQSNAQAVLSDAQTARVPSEITRNSDEAGAANARRQRDDAERETLTQFGPGHVGQSIGGISRFLDNLTGGALRQKLQ